jgi:hypothetical protein
MDLFYNELYCYKFGPLGNPCIINCNNICNQKSLAGCQVGHFTQMMWTTTTHLGCGIAHCQDEQIAVSCNYGSLHGAGGNFLGELPFSSEVAMRLGFSGTPCDRQNMKEEL